METPREIWVIESKLKKNSGGWWPQADKIYQEKRFAKVGLDELRQEFEHFDFRMVRYLPDGKGK